MTVCVCMRALCCTFIVPSLAACFARCHASLPYARKARSGPHSPAVSAQQGHNKLGFGDSAWCGVASICYHYSQHSLQLRHSIPECNGLSQFFEDTVPVQEIYLIACPLLIQLTKRPTPRPRLEPRPPIGLQPVRPSSVP